MSFNIQKECGKDENEYFKCSSIQEWVDEWTFRKCRTDMYTHKIHRYPAMFVPQVIRKIILEYTSENENVLDIFNGSGTTMVESLLTDRNGYGIELNPLANMITRVKTYRYNIDEIKDCFEYILKEFKQNKSYNIINFKNIEFWYSKNSITNISCLLDIINKIENVAIKEFYLIMLSDMLRDISYCNHSGFKMHRDAKKLNNEISPDVFIEKYKMKVKYGIESIQKLKYASKNNSTISIIEGDSRKMQNIAEDSMDLIITSPPYGDSRTTVAYGQFSRLSMQWFGIKPIEGNELNLDNFLLGGKKDKLEDYEEVINKSLTLNSVYESFLYKSLVNKEDAKKYIDRLRDILSFYSDMDLVLNNASKYLKNNKHCIFVTGSRIVKNVKLHTDIIISELASHYGFDLKGIMYRDIDSKRIPSKISASNIKGDTAATMTKESIVILKLNK